MRRVKRLWLRLRWALFHRRRHNHLVLERAAGRPIVVLPQVFNPTLFETSEIFARCLDARLVPRGCDVLDMGTGSGLMAIVAAQWAGRVVAVDINPAAVRCARINALLNDVDDRMDIIEGDLFAPLAGRAFDVVLFNPPYFRGSRDDGIGRAFRGDGVVERFAEALNRHLTPRGHALVILSSDADTNGMLLAFRSNGFSIDVVVERNLLNEVMTVYRLTRSR